MEDGPGVEEAIASAFEDLDLVVEPFHKTTVLSGLEIVGNRPPVSVQGALPSCLKLDRSGAPDAYL